MSPKTMRILADDARIEISGWSLKQVRDLSERLAVGKSLTAAEMQMFHHLLAHVVENAEVILAFEPSR